MFSSHPYGFFIIFIISRKGANLIFQFKSSLHCCSFSFLSAFPETKEGQKALKEAYQLLTPNSLSNSTGIPIQAIISLINSTHREELFINLTAEEQNMIKALGNSLPNRQLKGYYAQTEAEILALNPEDIDLSHALLLTQMTQEPNSEIKAFYYEALLDLMALQIAARLPQTATAIDKIRELNRFIFEEMQYRFPPHSTFIKNIDQYTYLSSVIDKRQGVCLGVSILYLCLSQRLNLSLEVITPPGHIYVRYRDPLQLVNIETTARGAHFPSEEYQGLQLIDFPVRTIKEVIGMAYFNEASLYWHNQNFQKAINLYEKALKYFPSDLLTQELLGYNYLFNGNIAEGESLLKALLNQPGAKQTLMHLDIIEDYFNHRIDIEGIKINFLPVDEKRSSLLLKKDQLIKLLTQWPNFRAALFSLSITWLQLNRFKEALTSLEKYEALEKQDLNAEYLLVELYMLRLNYRKAWEHFERLEKLIEAEKMPKKIKTLKKELQLHSAA